MSILLDLFNVSRQLDLTLVGWRLRAGCHDFIHCDGMEIVKKWLRGDERHRRCLWHNICVH